MIDRKKLHKTASVLQTGLATVMEFLEGEGPKMLQQAGERLHIVKPKRRIGNIGIALGLLGAAAVVGFLLKSSSTAEVEEAGF